MFPEQPQNAPPSVLGFSSKGIISSTLSVCKVIIFPQAIILVFISLQKLSGVFKYPVYHSIHDNFDWMTRFVDHDFRYHETIAKLWLQLALSLADGILLPFNIRRYGESLLKQAESIEKIKKSSGKAKDLNTGNN